ncbi:alanine--tRNA ligase [bacterium]|nr:alanine--tRNA ligase [bacterium]
MKSELVRKTFLDFFRERGHTIVPSSPVVPVGDPTLLFTNAGMNQFKDIFLGKVPCPYDPPRAASVQKCIRVSGKHNDLEEVGRDGWHHTFFEMLGNWSFGEYFKREAILWAWELMTKFYGIPAEKLWATVYESDDEAYRIWIEEIGLPPEKVVRCGMKDNFWEMADTGPCGPTTEIHYDWGKELDPDGVPNASDRFVEVWNIVFMQYFRDKDGELHDLPAKNVDTGMGFERLVAVLQGTRDNYQTDIFSPLIERISELSGHDYEEGGQITMAFRVLSDHIRALSFAIADGAIPGNTGRGYVLRRILRRAARFSRILGVHEPIMYKLVSPLVDKMGNVYPELKKNADTIAQIIKAEEERFGKTLDFGIELFNNIIEQLEKRGERTIPGEDAFRLYDTYGFPLDLTQLMARELGFDVDVDGFEKLMQKQRERARAAAGFDVVHKKKPDWIRITDGEDSRSLCYETERAEAQIRLARAGENNTVEVVLSQTPFYAERGGQVGDTGKLKGDGFELEVLDTQLEGEHIVHICRGDAAKLIEIFRSSPDVIAEVDHERRAEIRRNHTATHLLHKALRMVLGDHVRQAGSLVAPDRLRFDYTHFEAPTQEQLRRIEEIVNEKIMENLPVETVVTKYEDAIKSGAVALFEEKYGAVVRMVKINDFSKELCGGTHVSRTGDIGLFVIVREENIGSGMRRIEAMTGKHAYRYVSNLRNLWAEVERTLRATGDDVLTKIEKLFERIKELEKRSRHSGEFDAAKVASSLISEAKRINNAKLVVGKVNAVSRDELMQVLGILEKELPSALIFLASALENGKAAFVCRITADVIRKFGINAGELVKKAAQITGGGGGGRPDFAQAGGKNPEKIDEALKAVLKIIDKKFSNRGA